MSKWKSKFWLFKKKSDVHNKQSPRVILDITLTQNNKKNESSDPLWEIMMQNELKNLDFTIVNLWHCSEVQDYLFCWNLLTFSLYRVNVDKHYIWTFCFQKFQEHCFLLFIILWTSSFVLGSALKMLLQMSKFIFLKHVYTSFLYFRLKRGPF